MSKPRGGLLRKWFHQRPSPQEGAEHAEAASKITLNQMKAYLAGTYLATLFEIRIFCAPGAGESTLIRRFVTDMYVDEYDPCTEVYDSRHIPILESVAFVRLYGCGDPTAQTASAWHDCSRAYIMLLYNLSSRQSFLDMQAIHRHCVKQQAQHNGRLWLGAIVVATSCDLAGSTGSVERWEGKAFARANNLAFWVASAKTGFGCSRGDLSDILIKLLKQRLGRQQDPDAGPL